MIKELQLRVEPQFAYNEQVLKETVSRQCGLDVRTVTAVRTLKKSIDARQRTIFVNLTLRAFINEQPPKDEFERIDYFCRTMREILAFLRELSVNNKREWFLAHKDEYKRAKERFDAFALELLAQIRKFDPAIGDLNRLCKR